MRVSLIIPALNEAECLAPLLNEVPRELVDELIVVDNGSTDATSQVARAAGATVIAEPRRGYGYACASGSTGATGEVLVFMDGDGSFVPAELSRLVAPIVQGEAELVLGSRMLDKSQRQAIPPHQRLGNQLFTGLVWRRYGLAISDLGPFRAIRRELLLGLKMQEHTYGWPLEMILKAARRQLGILELPISYRPRFAGRSKVSGTLRGSLLTAYRYSLVMLRYAF